MIGVERVFDGARTAQQRAAPTAVCDVRNLPLRAEVDLLGAFDVIEHLDDGEGALCSMRTALRASGTLLLTVPARPRLWSEFDVASGHRRRYTAKSLCSVVARAGFEVRYLAPFMTILYPAARLRRRVGRPPSNAAAVIEAELQVSARVNALLYRL